MTLDTQDGIFVSFTIERSEEIELSWVSDNKPMVISKIVSILSGGRNTLRVTQSCKNQVLFRSSMDTLTQAECTTFEAVPVWSQAGPVP